MSATQNRLYVKHAVHSTITTQVKKVPQGFIAHDQEGLYTVLNHGTHLRIYSLSDEGMQMFRHHHLNASLSNISFTKLNGEWHLLLLTHEEKKVILMRWNHEIEDLDVVAHGIMEDRIGRLVKRGDRVRCVPLDEDRHAVFMLLYEGIVKYLSFEEDRITAKSALLKELDIIDLRFLNIDAAVEMVVLYRDAYAQRHLKCYRFDTDEGKVSDSTTFKSVQVDPQANLLMVHKNNVIVFGGKTISLHRPAIPEQTTVHFDQPTQVTAYTNISDAQVVFGTVHGKLYQLDVQGDKLNLKYMGQSSIPSDLEFLGYSFIHVSSVCGDSQLIQISDESREGSMVQVVDEFENIAPIMDASIVDFEKQGQGSIVTCSGKGTDGSLRIITNGISIETEAEIELEEAKRIFSLKRQYGSSNHDYLVLSFPRETKTLGFPDEELGPISIGFDLENATITCATTPTNQFLQATGKSVNVIGNGSLQTKWTPPDGKEILLAAIHKDMVLVSTGHDLYLIQEEANALKELAKTTRENLISSLALYDGFCAAGQWNTNSVELFKIPDFSLIESKSPKENIVPRSLLFARFEGIDYLLVGLGDGTLFYFTFSGEYTLSNMKKIIIGTKEIALRLFESDGTQYVFASSDRATTVFSQHKKLIFSNVNMKDLSDLCSFNHEILPNGLGLITPQSMLLGQITEVQNTHVKKIPLGCQPVKVAFDELSVTIAVCTLSHENSRDTNHVRLYQAYTFDELTTIQLDELEYGSSIACVNFGNDRYYSVGTAYVSPEEKEPKRGRILLFKVIDEKLVLTHQVEVKGAVYGIASLANGSRLLTAVNSRVQLWTLQDDKLKSLYTHVGHLLCLTLQAKNDFVLVGDLIRSVSVLRYDSEKDELVEIARDLNLLYLTATAILDDDNFLVIDNSRNAVILSKSASQNEMCHLSMSGQYYLGEGANVICEGSLKMRLDFPDMRTFAYCSTNGAIAMMATLSAQQYNLLSNLQNAMEELSGDQSFGNLKHRTYRSFKIHNRVSPSESFIDGDFAESFLTMDNGTQNIIAQKVGVSASDLSTEIEKISRALV